MEIPSKKGPRDPGDGKEKKRTATKCVFYRYVHTEKLHPYLLPFLVVAAVVVVCLAEECAPYRKIIFVYNLFFKHLLCTDSKTSDSRLSRSQTYSLLVHLLQSPPKICSFPGKTYAPVFRFVWFFCCRPLSMIYFLFRLSTCLGDKVCVQIVWRLRLFFFLAPCRMIFGALPSSRNVANRIRL